ncbi:MAG TPA: LytTR family DNA-binding domain-containing protein [Bryobacteraceae bacterium]|jgi:DNA-binding LytR/AlgR family response regulator
MNLRTLIVDDEPVARQVLREELAEIPGIDLLGEADGGLRALAMIDELEPDLVLLDLQMPEVGGFDVIRRIGTERRAPLLIIVTAWDQHALQAFDAGAVDYLLKPVGQARLTQAIERARRASGREAAEQLARLQEIGDGGGPPKRIVGRSGEEYFLLQTAEIFAFEADGDLVWIHTAKQKYLATQTLRVLEQRLAGANFRRIHRNALVNVNHVRKMSPLSSQRWLVTLGNNQEFIVSKRQAGGVRELLS